MHLHGSNGIIKSTETIPVTQLAKGKDLVILGYCGSAQHPYNFSARIKIYNFQRSVLLPFVIFRILDVLRLDVNSILNTFAQIINLDYRALKLLYLTYSYHSEENKKSIQQLLTTSSFIVSPKALLFFLVSEPIIPVLKPDGGASYESYTMETVDGEKAANVYLMYSNGEDIEDGNNPYVINHLSLIELCYYVIQYSIAIISITFGELSGLTSMEIKDLTDWLMKGIVTLFFTGPGLLVIIELISAIVSTYTNYKVMELSEMANALIEIGSCFADLIFFLIDCIIDAVTAEFRWETIVFWILAGISVIAEILVTWLSDGETVFARVILYVAIFAKITTDLIADWLDCDKIIG